MAPMPGKRNLPAELHRAANVGVKPSISTPSLAKRTPPPAVSRLDAKAAPLAKRAADLTDRG
jgi:hypothetical protein